MTRTAFSLQIRDRFVEVRDGLVQLRGLLLVAFGHLLYCEPLVLHQLAQGFNGLFLELYKLFHF